MSKKIEFINYVENLMAQVPNCAMSEEVESYWKALKQSDKTDKPMFTDNGKLILQYMKDHPEIETWKSKDIAEGLFISSRTVAGAIRKLVTDGFVEKMGKEPTIYSITETGKNIEIN